MYFYTGETTMQFGNAPRVKGIAKIEKVYIPSLSTKAGHC